MSRYLEYILCIFITLLIIGAISLCVFWGQALANIQACKQVAKETNKATKYRVWSGCYVKLDSEWAPLENWRVQK